MTIREEPQVHANRHRCFPGFTALDAVGSVCTGSLLLGAAGLLDGLSATTHWAYYDTLASLGSAPVEERVVDAGRIFTAAGVSAGIDLALTLVGRVAGADVAQAIQLGIEYDPIHRSTAAVRRLQVRRRFLDTPVRIDEFWPVHGSPLWNTLPRGGRNDHDRNARSRRP